MRLDTATAQTLNISREKAKKLILLGNICVDGIPQTQPRFEVEEQIITCTAELPIKNQSLKPNFEIPLHIIYEDADIAIINKQKGLIVHEGASENFHTLANALVAKYGENILKVGSGFRPGIVHRLDKNTTGLMVVAKTISAYNALTQMMQNREITKKYLALCFGKPRLLAGTIRANIGIDPSDRTKRKVLQIGGREAVTHYKVFDANEQFSLIECTLDTGRTHQIRVHLAHIGHSIIGDETYSKRKLDGYNTTLLHSYKLEFVHPITKKTLAFEHHDPSFNEARVKILVTINNLS